MAATAGSQDRFDRNLRALRQCLDPGLLDICARHRNRHVEVDFGPDGQFRNLLVGGAPLYQPDGPIYIADRMADLARNPQRIRFADNVETPTRFENLSTVAAEIVNDFAQTRFEYQDPYFGTVGSLVSLGLGAGVHLPDVIDRVDFVDLIVVEPELEFFIASLHVCDWVSVVARLLEKGGALTLVFEQDAALAFEVVLDAMRRRSFALIEGTCFFIHDTRPTMIQLMQRVAEAGLNLISYNGWLEDELRHACNHAVNVSADEVLVLSGRRADGEGPRRDGKVFVVTGSGPSLGENMDLLISQRDKIVLVSAGTSLRPLLKAGIKPDFHCELENVDAVPYLLRELDQDFDLTGITLVASTTVDPRVPGFFDKTIFFIREGDGVMPALKGPVEQIQFVGPSSVNTGIVLADWLGAPTIALLGADFGKPVDGGAYTDGVAYQSLEKINTERVKNGLHPIPPSGSTTGDMQIPVPGNAGVPVLSNNVLTMMRHRLESTVGMIAVPVLNIGRGALIAGTKPTAREALLSCLDEHARAVGMQSSGEGMPYGRSVERHRRQDFSAERSLAELRERFDEAFEGCINALRKFDGDERPISLDGIRSTFATLLWAERDPLPGESAAGRAARVSLSGSMLRIFHMIRHAYLRLFEKDRQRFARYCIAFLLDFLPVMKRETASSLTAAIDQAAPGTILPETPLGAIFRGIKAHQYPDRGMLEAGLFPKEGSGSRHLAQFILSDYYVAMTAQDSKGVTVEPWYMDMLAKSVRPAGSYSWFVRRCFALLRVVDDDLIDRRFLEALDRDAASILGAVRSGVHSQAAQFFLLYGNNGRSFDFVNMMVADPALTERKSILLGNAYFVAGKIDLALKAYEEAGMAGENLPDDDWRITPPGLELYGAALLISGREKEALAYYLRDGALAPIGAIVFSVLRPDMVEELKDRVVATSSVFNRKVTRILLEAKQAYGTMP